MIKSFYTKLKFRAKSSKIRKNAKNNEITNHYLSTNYHEAKISLLWK